MQRLFRTIEDSAVHKCCISCWVFRWFHLQLPLHNMLNPTSACEPQFAESTSALYAIVSYSILILLFWYLFGTHFAKSLCCSLYIATAHTLHNLSLACLELQEQQNWGKTSPPLQIFLTSKTVCGIKLKYSIFEIMESLDQIWLVVLVVVCSVFKTKAHFRVHIFWIVHVELDFF